MRLVAHFLSDFDRLGVLVVLVLEQGWVDNIEQFGQLHALCEILHHRERLPHLCNVEHSREDLDGDTRSCELATKKKKYFFFLLLLYT